MGYALPAIVGAYFSSGGPVISVVGDGSIMMNLQELQTISFLNIPAKIFVINNNAYAIIRKRQKDLFRRRTIGTDPQDGVGCPDFSKVADAFEFKFKKIEDAHNLEKNISDVLNTEGPVLCEVIGYEDQDYITTSYARTESKRFAYRPLEDQAPFLDRELFLKEMIIKPIDQ
jgi:acetolactate synthase-1/2/3 large subunit